jgi:hypothetical protein
VLRRERQQPVILFLPGLFYLLLLLFQVVSHEAATELRSAVRTTFLVARLIRRYRLHFTRFGVCGLQFNGHLPSTSSVLETDFSAGGALLYAKRDVRFRKLIRLVRGSLIDLSHW